MNTMKHDVVAIAENDVAKLEEQLRAAQDVLAEKNALTPVQRLAEALHEKFCLHDHAGFKGCEWRSVNGFAEPFVTYERRQWLKKAEAIIDTTGSYENGLAILDILTRDEEVGIDWLTA